MTPLSNAEFAERVLSLTHPEVPFAQQAAYDHDGDCIEFVARPDSFYGERIDDLITVYRSQESNEIVGALIKGVRDFCESMFEKYPGFRIEIEDGKVKLAYLFLAKLWAIKHTPSDLLTLTYKKLIEVAEESGIEAEMCEV